MTPANKDPSFQIKLSDFLDSHLGDSISAPIKPHLAEILEIFSKSLQCYVQWLDEWGKPLEKPLIWRYSAWAESVDRWEAAKAKSHKERVERFLFEANVKILAKKLKEEFGFEERYATTNAFSLLKKQQYTKIKCLGVKLLTKEEEL